MNVKLLGEYDFDNFTLLNALMNENEWVNTVIHEYTHFVLSNQSVYGTISYCLHKLIIPHDCKMDIDKKDATMKFFSKNVLKVQEGMAVFIESIYFLLRDKAEYESFINELYLNNRQYYDYVKPLCFILNMAKGKDRKTILSVAHAVFQVALESMNASIFDLDGKKFSTNRLIKKMTSKQDFSKEYIPNKRFLLMLNDCKQATSCDELIEMLRNKVDPKDTMNIVAESIERLEKIKDFVLDMFSDSKYIDLYKNKLGEIQIKEKDISEVFLQQIPTAFNEDYIDKKMKMTSWEIIKQKCKGAEYSTLFLLGTVKENLSRLLIEMGVIEPKMSEDEREILFFYDLRSKEVYGCVLEEKQLQEILDDDENKSVLLTSYKNYDYENECIPKHSKTNRFTYIYCDRTYNNAIDYLNKWANRNVYYRYMIYESMPVLLIKNSNSSIFILPMTPIVADEADRDIRKNHKNILMAADVKDGEYDSHVITDFKKRDEIDTIINCLFFINLSVPDEKNH